MKIVAILYENSDKFTKVANEWLSCKTKLKPRIVFWFKGGFLPRFGAKKISEITQKMSPTRINKGEYTPL